jgi:hypothetical protein
MDSCTSLNGAGFLIGIIINISARYQAVRISGDLIPLPTHEKMEGSCSIYKESAEKKPKNPETRA